MAHLLQAPSADTDLTYVNWLIGDYYVITWLLNNLEEKINGSVMFLTTAKEIWDTLNVMYDNEKNPSRVFEIYECLFELKHENKVIPELYEAVSYTHLTLPTIYSV